MYCQEREWENSFGLPVPKNSTLGWERMGGTALALFGFLTLLHAPLSKQKAKIVAFPLGVGLAFCRSLLGSQELSEVPKAKIKTNKKEQEVTGGFLSGLRGR